MKTYKLTYYFWNNPNKEEEMIVKAENIIEAKKIGAKKINRKYHNSISFCWNGFEVVG